jgi:hypothetical protein
MDVRGFPRRPASSRGGGNDFELTHMERNGVNRQRDIPDSPVSLPGRLRAAWQAHPRRLVAIAVGIAAAAGFLVALLGQLGPRWQRYELKNLDLVLELPADPAGESAGPDGKAGVTYRANTPDPAVLINGDAIAPGTPVQAKFMVEQAMGFVRSGEGIEDLAYQVTEKRIRGLPCLHVSGTFRLGGAPARLSGLFFFRPDRHAHVLCFYSTDKGAAAARRVLRSIRFGDS